MGSAYGIVDHRITPSQLQAATNGGGSTRQFPETEDDWQAEYSRRFRAYVSDPYTGSEIIGLHLFKALDESGDILATTRRLTLDYAFVCNTDTAALIGDGISLQGEAADRADGVEVWERSGLLDHVERYARDFAVKGDIHLEALVGADGLSRVVAYAPEHVVLTYDAETATQITRAVVTIPYYDEPEIDRFGNAGAENQIGHIYRRVITADAIEVYRDGVLDTDESGPNSLGAVTLVHVPFIPFATPNHGLNAAYQLDEALALIDSLLTQISAIGARHGNPILQSAGAKVDGGSDILKLGRVANGPKDWTLEYIEPSFAGIASLLDTVQQHRETLRETLPEFLFTESGANSSGSALNFRASQFVSKMTPIRRRFYRAIATVSGYAIHLDRKTTPAEAPIRLRVEGGDILPANVTATLEQLRIVQQELGGLLPVDLIATLQRIGLVPKDVDPAQYAAEVAAVKIATTAIETEATTPTADADAPATAEAPPPDAPIPDAAAAMAAELALNGAQITAALSIAERVAGGLLMDSAARELLMAVGLSAEAAGRILAGIGSLPEPAPAAAPSTDA